MGATHPVPGDGDSICSWRWLFFPLVRVSPSSPGAIFAAVERLFPYHRSSPVSSMRQGGDGLPGLSSHPWARKGSAETRVPHQATRSVLRVRLFMENSGASSSGISDVEQMMKELGLKEEDLDDVVFDEQPAPPEGPRWVALARVNTSKTYSQTWFFRNMRSAWDIAQEARFKPLEENLYTVTFTCLGDWERVMNDGPWNFSAGEVPTKHRRRPAELHCSVGYASSDPSLLHCNTDGLPTASRRHRRSCSSNGSDDAQL